MTEHEPMQFSDEDKKRAADEAERLVRELRARSLDAARQEQQAIDTMHLFRKEGYGRTAREFRGRRTFPVISGITNMLREVPRYSEEEKEVVDTAQVAGIVIFGFAGIQFILDSIAISSALTGGMVLAGFVLGGIIGYGLGRLAGIGIVKTLRSKRK